MNRIVTDAQSMSDLLSAWVAARAGHARPWEGAATISLWNSELSPLAVAVYECYSPQNVNVHFAAADDSQDADPAFLRAVFAYPFVQLNCVRVTTFIPESCGDRCKFAEGLGFVREGRARRGAHDKSDLLIYGMLREECLFLENAHG